MRSIPTHIWDVWNAGGPAIGTDSAVHGRVTVDINWYLHDQAFYGGPVSNRGPYRAFQTQANDQVETEVPNIEVIQIDRSIDQDAGTCKITLSNTWFLQNGAVTPTGDIGEPGFFTFSRANSAEAISRWGQSVNVWNNILVPDALLRTYQGYGGKTKTVLQAQTDGNIVLTGVWLIDSVRIGTNGKVELACRDMAKLLIEQQIYPPLVPINNQTATSTVYPLQYCRWGTQDLASGNTLLTVAAPAQFGDPQVTPVMWSGATDYNGAVPQPDYPDYSGNEPGNGYWLMVDDGTVHNFGNNPSYGSASVSFSANPAVKIESTVTGKGYWMLTRDGVVTPFGDAPNYGNHTTGNAAISMARNHRGDGYWTIDYQGVVQNHGSTAALGSPPLAPLSFSWADTIAVDIAGDPVGEGYWVLTNEGNIYAFGSAVDYGNAVGSIYPVTGLVVRTFVRVRPNPNGFGYWIIDQVGEVHAFGTSTYYGQLAGQAYAAVGGGLPFANSFFPDYMSDLIPSPSGLGYLLLGVSGGVYPFGDAVFFGALNGGYDASLRIDGNFRDYSDVVSELLLWSGFWLAGTNPPQVYGNIESTGAFPSNTCLDDGMFDKLPVISPITKIKEVVGYHLWVDEEGAVHFESPNLFSQGNFDETGTHIATIPNIDEAIQLTDYAIEYKDTSARSQVIISTTDPTTPLTDTVTTFYTPPTAALLRGMIKPGMWVNGVFTLKREQLIMAELISLYIWLAQRQGSVTFMANPAIQINDQVRIWERITSETYIHYVRGLSSTMDLVAGTYTMTATTHWMGDNTNWAVQIGLEPYSFGFTTPRTMTYSKATDDLSGTTALPNLTLDGNLATAWRPRGGNGQVLSEAVEYVEFTMNGTDTIDTVGVYTAGYLSGSVTPTVYVSVMVGGVWQAGAGTVAYSPINPPGAFSGATPAIAYLASSAVASEAPYTIPLGGTYTPQRVRITMKGFGPGKWGPFWYEGGLRTVQVGIA